MTKEKDNSQVVLDDILTVFHKERAPTLSEAEFFEVFSAEQLLKDYELSYDELQDGIVDGEHDGGVDSFFAFSNGELITEDFDPAGFRKDVHLEVFIIQSKTGSKFEEAAVDRLISVTNKMMDLTVDPDSHTEISVAVRSKFKQFRDAYRALAARFPRVTIRYFLAAKRPDQPLSLISMVYWLGDQPAALLNAIRMTNKATAKVIVPMTMVRASRSLISWRRSTLTGGGESRRIRDTRDTGAARSTAFFLLWNGLAMASVPKAKRLSSC